MANEPTIAEMNKAIAEFMGAKDTGNCFVEIPGRTYSLSSRNYPRSLRYNLYWDWLKPVIDEIFKYALAYPDQVKPIIAMSVVVDIKAAHEKVYQFCKWLNQHRKLLKII